MWDKKKEEERVRLRIRMLSDPIEKHSAFVLYID